MARLLAAAALWLALVGPAAAHAVLLAATPADGAALDRPPAEVTLTFNEPVAPIAVSLLDGAGRTLAHDVTARDARIVLRIPPGLPPGGYVATYRVTSVDGHPVAGSVLFTVGADAAPAARPELDDGAAAWTVVAVALQALQIGGALVAIGGILSRRLIGPALPRGRTVPRAAAVSALAAVAGLAVAGARLTGGGWAALADAGAWRIGAASSHGLGLALLLPALALSAWGRLPVAPIAALLAAAGFAVTGHAGTAPPAWLAGPALGLHVLCAAYWLGALAPLVVLIRRDPAGAVPVLRRFSRLAAPALALLLLTGGTLAAIQVAAPAALIGTAYGRILLAKLAVVAGLLGLALWNKRRLTPRLPGSAGALIGAILVEFVLFAAVVAATAALGEVTPPRALAAADAHAHHQPAGAGITAAAAAGRLQALVTLEPAQRGRNRLTVTLADGAGAPLDPLAVTVSLANPGAGVEAIERPMRRVAPGSWQLDDCPLPLGGRWQVDLSVLVTDFETTTIPTTFDIP